jgi:hypothetical protein
MQHQQVPAEFHPGADHQVRALEGQHLPDIGENLVDGVQGIEQVDEAGVRDDAQVRLPDLDAAVVFEVITGALGPGGRVDRDRPVLRCRGRVRHEQSVPSPSAA